MSNTAATPLLSVQDLHVHYGKSHILHGVTFEVQEGEVVSLLGRNGSGRSTTIKSIMGLVPPTSGQIRFGRSEEHTSELQSLMRISYAVFCLKNKKSTNQLNY